MHMDLTPGVMTGLAWYYLLAAMLNAAAAAYVSYMEIVSEEPRASGWLSDAATPRMAADQLSGCTAWPL